MAQSAIAAAYVSPAKAGAQLCKDMIQNDTYFLGGNIAQGYYGPYQDTQVP